ncbi:WcaA Glycosyltransferases involved in cell wall biogenesis [Flavobacteriaceae bacterium]
MANALVSIITPTFNSEKFIAETIQSVQSQTYENWEMIIVDDCSSDETFLIISNFSKNDNRIKIHQLKNNFGAGVARNEGVNLATGRFISFLDSDDLWKPSKLKKQVEFLISNNLPFTFSFYERINEDGKQLNKIVGCPKKLHYFQLFFCNFIGNLTGIYDVSYFGKINISSIRKRQDWIMWLSILKKTKIALPIPESLAYYRVRVNSISASKYDLIKHNFSVYRNYHKLNIVKSILCMIGFVFTQIIIKPFYIKNLNK